MADVTPGYDLAALAPSLVPGEALSSWLARLADAHLITVAELQEVIGGPLTAFERGNLKGLDRVIAMTGLRGLSADAIAPPDLRAHPIRPGPPPPECWAVCRQCLEADVEAGRATHCDVHRAPLAPHGNSPIPIASALTLWGEQGRPKETRDILLEAAALQDIAAALAVRLNGYSYSGSLMSLFEEPIFDRKSAPGALQIEREWWARLDAATRLLYVRVALFILAEPPDPAARDRKWPLRPDWLTSRYRHYKSRGWDALFAHAARDPLLLVATELPAKMVLELGEMSLAWPADLRQRWTYAAAEGVSFFEWRSVREFGVRQSRVLESDSRRVAIALVYAG